MGASFDLLDEQWIPVRKGPHTTVVGLRELFRRAHELDDLALPIPPAAAGLWRILYAITARVTGLDDPDGWGDRQADRFADREFDVKRAEKYLLGLRARFDLFDPERPWLQDPRLATQCGKSSGVNKLVFDRPSGQNQVWFGHYADIDPVPLPAAEAAWYLIAQLYYGASGRCTSRTVDGQAFANVNAGPLRTALSFHPIGHTLFESLVLGVPEPQAGNEDVDLCPWERDELPDPLGVPHPLTWPGGLLAGRAQHAVLLVPAPDGRTVTDAYVTWARREPPMRAPDPYVVQRFNKDGEPFTLKADGSRALWRDVDALLADDVDRRRPSIIASAGGVGDEEIRVRAYGFDQDGQAKDRQWFTAVTPPILRWLEERDHEAARGIATLHRAAEGVAGRLRSAVKAAWEELSGSKERTGPWVRPAETFFWAEAERAFWERVRARDFDEPWRAFLVLGHRAIDHATDGKTHRPRVAKVVAAAHSRLTGTARRRGEEGS